MIYCNLIRYGLLLCPVLAFVFRKWIRPNYLKLQSKVTKGWYTFAAIALIFYVLMSMAVSVPTLITQRLEQLPTVILLLILLPFLYLHLFSTLHHQQKSYEIAEQEKIHSIQVTSLLSCVEEFSAANQRLQEERHDFRHKMRAIASLSEKGDLASICRTAKEYVKNLPEHSVERYCDHKILDAVLASYLDWAKRKGIRVTTKMIFPEVLPVNETALATAIANALENAIQACEKVETSKRYIEIKSIITPCFMIRVRNSFDGTVAFDEEGIPLAAKKGHGFGTRSIVTFCNTNRAFYEFRAEDNEFTLRLVFNQ